MSSSQRVLRPIARSLRQDRVLQSSQLAIRTFSRSGASRQDVSTTTTAPPPGAATPPPGAATPLPGAATPPPGAAAPPQGAAAPPQGADASSQPAKVETQKPSSAPNRDPETTVGYWNELRMMKKGTPPVGSRRRRLAIRTSPNVPFELMPYQAFQEARKILQEDRKEKLEALVVEIAKIKRLEATPGNELPGGERKKNMRIASLKKYVERLKILADVNDPIVKKRFEDGLGDMNKPIYRYYAERKWRGYPLRLLTQRIEQLNIVPDVLPKFEPTMDVQLFFRRDKVEPGEILPSIKTEVVPRLRVQVFDAGERLVSVAIIDSDVPNAETDSFERRCHYLSANIPLSPVQQSLPLGMVNRETQLAVPYLPAFSQKGAPYHRLSIFILEQNGKTLDIEELRKLYSSRDGFSIKSYRDKFGLTPVGFNLFRTVWDEHTAAVMERAGQPGADIEFKHKRVHTLKGEKRRRGWEFKRQKPKYKHLWHYTHMIRGQPRVRNR